MSTNGRNNNNLEYVYNNNNTGNVNQENNDKSEKAFLDFITNGDVEKILTYIQREYPIPKHSLTTATINASASKTKSDLETRIRILTLLLQSGLNPSLPDPRYRGTSDEINSYPMNFAAMIVEPYAPEVMQFLFDAGAPLNPTVLFSAIEKDNVPTFQKAIELGASTKEVHPTKKYPPIYAAVLAQASEIVFFLVKENVKLNYVDLIGNNTLITAVKLVPVRDPPAQIFLIEEKERREIDAYYKSLDIVRHLARSPSIDATFVNKSKKTASAVAAEMGSLAALEILLSDQRFVTVLKEERPRSSSTVQLAMNKLVAPTNEERQRALDILTFLKRKGARIEQALLDDMHPLFSAVQNDNLQLLEDLITLGFDLSTKTAGGNSLLMAAVGTSTLPVIQFLLDKGAGVNFIGTNGLSPLDYAMARGDEEIVSLLISRGAQVSLFPIIYSTRTPTEKYTLIVDLIEKYKLDVGVLDGENNTLIMAAAKVNDLQLVELFSSFNSIYFDQRNTQGLTAYELTKSAIIRELLIPHMEIDKPRFKGYTKDDILMFDLFWAKQEPDSREIQRNTTLCPVCFAFVERIDACMYVKHNCVSEAAQNPTIHIHKTLYKTMRNANNEIEWCILCNRFCRPHAHTEVAPLIFSLPAKIQPRDPFALTCYVNGGGDMPEKITRWQRLLEHMSMMNEKYIGRVSENMAKCWAKEAFWEAYLDPLPKEVSDRIYDNQAFEPTSEFPDAVLEEEVVADVINAPNVPRHPNNVGLLPKTLAEGVRDGEEQRCDYHSEVHDDARDLFQFFHRQPALPGQAEGEIFDHATNLICQEALEEFIGYLVYDITTPIKCFATLDCKGHFHPDEIRGIVDDELYESYRKRYNINPPRLRGLEGGGRPGRLFYILDASRVDATCPLPPRKRGGKRKTRRVRKMKKTRRIKRHSKTRKHK